MTAPRPSPEFLALQRALIGRFSLVRELGRGGMGIVFLARDVALDRNVAIKLLPPHLAALPNYRQRFLREARLAAALSHPHIVPIHLVDEVDDLVFFVMGFIDGETLGERVRRRGPLAAQEVARIVQQVAWGLAHAHARGVVHRDVKPDNILLERESGRAVVTDFGIAGGDAAVTPADGEPLGTPLYLSPEQAAGASGDARSDLYALGVTAWFALTGSHPHPATALPALLLRKSTAPAPSIRSARADLPPALSNAIDRSLAQHPAERWPDAESLAHALEVGGARSSVPPRIRAFVRVTMPLGTELAASATASVAALGMMAVLSQGGLIDAIIAQALAVPMIALALAYGAIRAGQSGMALLDVVREGHDHDTVARAVAEEERELALEVDPAREAQRARDAWWYGTLGTAKTGAALFIASTSLPTWITVPCAIGAVIIPTVQVLKVWSIMRPGPGRWPGLVRGRLGRSIMSLMRRFVGDAGGAVREHAPTITLLGGAIDEVYRALPDEKRRALGDLPALARQLQRDASAAAAASDPASRERAASVAAALEAIRVELLFLQAGLRDVRDVTQQLDAARQLGERVDHLLSDRSGAESRDLARREQTDVSSAGQSTSREITPVG